MSDGDDEDTGPVRLWPAAVALGLAAILAVVVAIVVLAEGENDGGRPQERSMRIVLAAAGDGGAVRVVTVGSPCLAAVRAEADLRADAIAISVVGANRDDGPGSGRRCAVDVATCHDIVLPQAVGPRRVLPRPVSDPEVRAGAERLVAEGPCSPLPLGG